MAKNLNNPALVISQKIFERLLLAYPKAHRAEYGAAMAQLFRDQCRDAWDESQGWGVMKLWLRVLPDLVNTSIAERLSALSERKSMSDKLANLFRFRQATPMVTFFAIFFATFLSVVVINFILPKYYASSARVLLSYKNDEKRTQQMVSYDPYVVQTEMEIICSDAVLETVIKKLALDQEWSKRYANEKFLETTASIELLKQRVILRPEGKSRDGNVLFHIQVYDEQAAEATRIANAIVESYRELTDRNASTGQTRPMKRIDIVQNATPGFSARPNKPANLFWGAVAGIGLGLMAVVAIKIGRSITRWLSRRKAHA